MRGAMRDFVSKPLTRAQTLMRCRELALRLIDQWTAPTFDRSKIAALTFEIETLLKSIGLGTRRDQWADDQRAS